MSIAKEKLDWNSTIYNEDDKFFILIIRMVKNKTNKKIGEKRLTEIPGSWQSAGKKR